MDVLGKLMQQICSTREAGWLLLSWENSEFLLKLKGNKMQYDMLIFETKNVDNIYFLINLPFPHKLSGKRWEKSRQLDEATYICPTNLGLLVFHRTGLVFFAFL